MTYTRCGSPFNVWLTSCVVIAGCMLGACRDSGRMKAADGRPLIKELAAMHLQGRTYGEAYTALATAGFDCGPYLFDQGISSERLARKLNMTCHRDRSHRFRCDTYETVEVTGAKQTWRIENFSSRAGKVCD